MSSQDYPKQPSVFAAAEDSVLCYKNKTTNKKGNTKQGLDHSQNLQGICVRSKTDKRF